MASRIDGKGVLWALFFVLIILALFDILATDSVIVDFFTGSRTPSANRLERAADRVLNR
jgi:uncharacterized integral membrane protein